MRSILLTVFARLKTALTARRLRWESLCKECGQCCYEKELFNGRVYVKPDRPCRYLDLTTRRCRVYVQRFQVCPQCRKVRWWHARFSEWMPSSCGYVEYYRRRGAKVRKPLQR